MKNKTLTKLRIILKDKFPLTIHLPMKLTQKQMDNISDQILDQVGVAGVDYGNYKEYPQEVATLVTLK